jgi:hypothetical protein
MNSAEMAVAITLMARITLIATRDLQWIGAVGFEALDGAPDHAWFPRLVVDASSQGGGDRAGVWHHHFGRRKKTEAQVAKQAVGTVECTATRAVATTDDNDCRSRTSSCDAGNHVSFVLRSNAPHQQHHM